MRSDAAQSCFVNNKTGSMGFGALLIVVVQIRWVFND